MPVFRHIWETAVANQFSEETRFEMRTFREFEELERLCVALQVCDNSESLLSPGSQASESFVEVLRGP